MFESAIWIPLCSEESEGSVDADGFEFAIALFLMLLLILLCYQKVKDPC
jgi:hypothetical protein